jgi:2-iminobutanoate/2-iminopropanoate deaminase
MARLDQVFHLRPEGEKAFGYAQAVKVGSLLFVSGALSVDQSFGVVAAGDMQAQIANVYRDIEATLRAHGAGFRNVVKETIFVTDMPAFLAANEHRTKLYEGFGPPATTAVQVTSLAFPGLMIEIEAIADLS